ncbi:MAG: hypothetical protein GXO75_05700 [Calditrichaeota bacterium]|nr:hypothetical protein [Calditrichota bacterium]
MRPLFQILFVCSGNICRSPMAEGYFRALIPRRLKDKVRIISAGTLGILGRPASLETIEVMHERSIDIIEHRSQGVTKNLTDKSNIIFAMAYDHYKILRDYFPDRKKDIYLLRSFNKNKPSRQDSIPDPIGLDFETYLHCRDTIEEEMKRITPHIIKLIDDYYAADKSA